MLPDLISALGAEARRNLARNLFPGFWERGTTANDALSELRSMGLGYRRTDFLSDFRSGQTTYQHETAIRYVGLDNVPSERALEPQYHGVPDRYSFVYKVTGTDTSTGEPSERYFFYHRNNLDSRGNMESEAMDWYSEQADRYGLDPEAITTVEGYVNPVWE